jgi:hypothetical protein
MDIKKVAKDVGAVCSSKEKGLLQGGEVVESKRATRNQSTRLKAVESNTGCEASECRRRQKDGAVNESKVVGCGRG